MTSSVYLRHSFQTFYGFGSVLDLRVSFPRFQPSGSTLLFTCGDQYTISRQNGMTIFCYNTDMDIGRLSYYSRRVHRVAMLFVIVLGIIQMVTGSIMKYPQMFTGIDQGSVRVLHFDVATYFSIAFFIQMVTGLIMYIAPKLIKAFRRPSSPPTI